MYRSIWSLSWPLILSNISVPLLGLVDTAILAHLDDSSHLAAVALGSSVLAFVYWGFGFLRMGTTSLTARFVGQGSTDKVNLVLFQSLVLSLLISLVILLLFDSLSQLILWLLVDASSLSVQAKAYSDIRILSIPAVLLTFCLHGWFIGKQDTKRPVILLITVNLLNIVFDIIFVLGLKLGSVGAAYACVLAEYCGLALGLFFITKGNILRVIPWNTIWDIHSYKALFITNQHLFLRTFLLIVTFTFFTAQGAKFGNTVIASNAILMQVILFSSFALDGFAQALEALVGRYLGENKLPYFYKAIKTAVMFACVFISIYLLVLGLCESMIILGITGITEVQAQLSKDWHWTLWVVLISMPAYLLDGIFIGAGKTKAMRNMMILSVFGVYFPLWYLFQSNQNSGLWMAFTGFSVARALSLGWVFYQTSKKDNWVL